MNILILSPFNPLEFSEFLNEDSANIPNINAGASAVHTVVREFLKDGHQVTVITYNMQKKPICDCCLRGKLLTIEILPQNTIFPKGMVLVRWYMVKRMIKVINKYIDKCDVIHAHWTYDFALAASHFSSVKPVFCTVRDWAPYIYSLSKSLYWYVSLKVAKKVYADSNIHFIANSEYTYSKIKEEYKDKDVFIIYNPIMKDNILKSRQDYPEKMFFVSVSQSNDTRKNYKKLLEAFQIVRSKKSFETELWLIGGCFTLDSSVCQEWKSLGLLDDVQLMGAKNRKELFALLDKASAMVHPALEETFGNILLEAMARRLPVIGGKASGAVPKVLGDGKFGWTCDVTDENDIAKVMLSLHNNSEMPKKVENATLQLLKVYSSDVIAQEHIKLYQKML